MSKVWGPFSDHPNLRTAAKSGTPEMQRLNPTVPRSVPATAIAGNATENQVTVETPANPNVLDTNPDARANGGKPVTGGASGPEPAPGSATPATTTGAAGATPAAGTAAPAGGTAAPAAGATAPGTAKTTDSATPQNHTGKVKTPKPPKKKKSKKSDNTSQQTNQTPPPQTPAKPGGGGGQNQTPAPTGKQ
jgi:hypothetical protein